MILFFKRKYTFIFKEVINYANKPDNRVHTFSLILCRYNIIECLKIQLRNKKRTKISPAKVIFAACNFLHNRINGKFVGDSKEYLTDIRQNSAIILFITGGPYVCHAIPRVSGVH